MTMNDMHELNDSELNAVIGGSIVDTVVGVATQIWNIITGPTPRGVKGESMDRDHRGTICLLYTSDAADE